MGNSDSIGGIIAYFINKKTAAEPLRKTFFPMSSFQRKLTVSLIITIAVVLSIASFWNDSVIVDEIPHIGSGYSYITKGDYRLNPEHPPLVKDLAAIPLLFQKIDTEKLFSTRFWTEDVNGQWNFGRFLIFSAADDPQTVSRTAKFPVLIFFILSAILVFYWTRKKYGDFAGYISLLLFTFSPTIMAHARFVTTDMAALFGVLFATYFFIKYLKLSTNQGPEYPRTGKNFWLASVFFGIALLTKFSTFLLVPYFLFLAAIWGFIGQKSLKNKLRATVYQSLITVLIFIVGFIIIVWPVYYLHTFNYPPERQQADTAQNLSTFGRRLAADPVIWASDKPVLRAAAQYGHGLLMVVQRSVGGNTTYFWGEVSRTAWKKYFPVVYFIKEPFAWWGLVILAFGAIIARAKLRKLKIKNWIKNYFTEFAMLTWLGIYWYVSITSNLNIGVRHLLPIYPFTIILISGQVGRLKTSLKNSFLYLLIVTAFMGWYIFENISVYPYYLTYFNQSVGGPSGGHKIVADSNLDWGQDLKRFSDWVEKENIRKIDFDYFGWADQGWYLGDKLNWTNSRTYKDLEEFKRKNDTDGWIAVSVTFLMGSRGGENGDYQWLRQQTPVTVIGNSISVYKIKE